MLAILITKEQLSMRLEDNSIFRSVYETGQQQQEKQVSRRKVKCEIVKQKKEGNIFFFSGEGGGVKMLFLYRDSNS